MIDKWIWVFNYISVYETTGRTWYNITPNTSTLRRCGTVYPDYGLNIDLPIYSSFILHFLITIILLYKLSKSSSTNRYLLELSFEYFCQKHSRVTLCPWNCVFETKGLFYYITDVYEMVFEPSRICDNSWANHKRSDEIKGESKFYLNKRPC